MEPECADRSRQSRAIVPRSARERKKSNESRALQLTSVSPRSLALLVRIDPSQQFISFEFHSLALTWHSRVNVNKSADCRSSFALVWNCVRFADVLFLMSPSVSAVSFLRPPRPSASLIAITCQLDGASLCHTTPFCVPLPLNANVKWNTTYN